jgi:dihydroneopterin aldolase/2-amino-4-hydroxy-6-hydroxymethyldihydropteridine diphosphokinase
MKDKIIISKLMVYCNHGVFEEEKINGQNFYVSAEITLDTEKQGNSDDINDTVNYAEVCMLITEFMQHNNFNLIEAVAENLAVHLLEFNNKIHSVKIRIDKPEAPIKLPFETVAIEIERSWHTAYIGLGGNMGDTSTILQQAIAKIENTEGIFLTKESAMIMTEPYGGVKQDNYLNCVVEIKTYHNPYKLLEIFNKYEAEAGRVRDVHWGPRTLDIDIIMYDDEIIHDERLIIPHVDMQNRTFVLAPLAEIAPYAFNPVTRKTVEQMLTELREKEKE